MFTEQIVLSSVNQVKSFVDKMSKHPFEINLSNGRYTVNAKSIMGVLSLDLTKMITLTAQCEEDEALRSDLADYKK